MTGLTIDAEAFAKRMILEAFQDASANWWRRRAVQFDRIGSERADEIADACRAKARFIELYGVDGAAEDLEAVLREQAAA